MEPIVEATTEWRGPRIDLKSLFVSGHACLGARYQYLMFPCRKWSMSKYCEIVEGVSPRVSLELLWLVDQLDSNAHQEQSLRDGRWAQLNVDQKHSVSSLVNELQLTILTILPVASLSSSLWAIIVPSRLSNIFSNAANFFGAVDYRHHLPSTLWHPLPTQHLSNNISLLQPWLLLSIVEFIHWLTVSPSRAIPVALYSFFFVYGTSRNSARYLDLPKSYQNRSSVTKLHLRLLRKFPDYPYMFLKVCGSKAEIYYINNGK